MDQLGHEAMIAAQCHDVQCQSAQLTRLAPLVRTMSGPPEAHLLWIEIHLVLPECYHTVMAVKKISVALDPDVAEAAASAAEHHGQSLSAWLNQAARMQLRIEDGLNAVAEWEATNGALTPAERAAADQTLDQLVGRPLPRSA